MTLTVRDLQPSNIVTLDFETYYDSDYSLTKMSTSEYIRDARFKAHMVGLKIGTKKTKWIPHEQIAAELAKIKWHKMALLCHNTAFDGFILSHVYGHIPAIYLDTYSMARAAHGLHIRLSLAALSELHKIGGKSKEALEATSGMVTIPPEILAKLGVYCINDVDLTYELYQKLYPHIPDDELRLIDITLRMFCEPVLDLDLDLVNESLAEEVGGKISALMLCGETPENLISDNKFADALVRAGIPKPPQKKSPTNGKLCWAFAKTDQGLKELLQHPNEQIRLLAEARLKLKSSIGETRARRFLEAGRDGMKLPVMLNYCGAHTTRWSGGGRMNMQNLKRGGKLRRSILAPPGYSVVVADSAQIEARVLAWLAGQKNISAAFANSEDVYKLMASEIYNIPIEQVDKGQRFLGKVCLTADTQVLTISGWKNIIDVQLTDLVWDGIEWVKHRGLLHQGTKEVLRTQHFGATPDHEVLVGHSWRAWSEVLTNPSLLTLATHSVNLPWSIGKDDSINTVKTTALNQSCDAPAAGKDMFPGQTSKLADQPGATNAHRLRPLQNAIGNTLASWRMMHTGLGYLTDCPHKLYAVIIQTVHRIVIMVNAASQSTNHGEQTAQPGWHTLLRLKDGISRTSSSIGSMLTKGMNLGTCVSAQKAITLKTEGTLVISKTNCPVYDLICAGPRTRFTVLGPIGPIIVHNCVLGLGYGMGHDKLRATLKQGALGGDPIDLPLEECKRIVTMYRAKSQAIVKLWKEMDNMLKRMLIKASGKFKCLEFGPGYIKLPNGLFLHYPGLRAVEGKFEGWQEVSYMTARGFTKIYGGLLTENVTQALARVIIGEQMLAIADLGYRIVTMSHDEIVVIVPTEIADEAFENMIRIMSTAPEWAEGLVLSAEGGHAPNYSK